MVDKIINFAKVSDKQKKIGKKKNLPTSSTVAITVTKKRHHV